MSALKIAWKFVLLNWPSVTINSLKRFYSAGEGFMKATFRAVLCEFLARSSRNGGNYTHTGTSSTAPELPTISAENRTRK
jgi:hypothetical protein